jgi:protein-arginine kinase activator protein McsA
LGLAREQCGEQSQEMAEREAAEQALARYDQEQRGAFEELSCNLHAGGDDDRKAPATNSLATGLPPKGKGKDKRKGKGKEKGKGCKRGGGEEDEEEEKRQAELRRAQDQLKKCLDDEDYTGAAAVKENIAALMSAGPCSQRNHGRSSAVTAAGHGSREEEEKRRAELLRAQDQLKKCLEEEDYRGAAAAKENISTLMGAEPCSHRVAESGGNVAGIRHSSMETSQGELSSIENLAGRLPQVCLPVRLEGATLLSIGKVSDPPNNDKGKGQGKGQGEKGKKSKKGKKGMIETGTQKMQPVYFGDDRGRVICTLATGDDVNRIPATLPRNAYVDISALKPQAGQLGVLFWTESTQMSLRLRPRDSGCDYIFPYDVMSDYSKDFASMAFVRQCAVGTYVAIAMRITDVQPKWTSTQNEPYLQLMAVDTDREVVGPLRLWQREEGDIKLGGAYVVRGLKVVNDRAWDSTKAIWIRSADAPKIIECSARTAWEDVEDVESITQYL